MSDADLDFAIRMRKPPDLFELRLDRLVRIVDELENKLPSLCAPLIITARHPQEAALINCRFGSDAISSPDSYTVPLMSMLNCVRRLPSVRYSN